MMDGKLTNFPEDFNLNKTNFNLLITIIGK